MEMGAKVVAVIGAGNGGCATAADLALSHWDVNLFEFPRFKNNIEPLIAQGGIHITGAANQGFAKLAKMTTDIREAVKGTQYVLVTTQSLAHEDTAVQMAPHVESGQVIFLTPGSGGSLVFGKVFRDKGVTEAPDIAETITLPYGCRKTSPTTVNVTRFLGNILLAALPSRSNKRVLEAFREMYPNSSLMSNVLEVAISNPNLFFHPGPSMLSMSRIEFSKGDFGLYQEGFMPSVMKVVDRFDSEVMAIQEKLGFPIRSYKQLIEFRYGKSFDEHFQFIVKVGSRGPFDVRTRYITEDVPIGLVLVSSLGKYLGVSTPTCDAIIHLCGVMNDTDFWHKGRTLESLGIAGLSLEALKRVLTDGYK
jgi:opine dehydrogenase